MPVNRKAAAANAFTDIHHHLLYGLDDGPATAEDMAAMLQAAYASGVKTLVATPHISPGIVPFAWETFWQRMAQAQQASHALGLDMAILPGAEMLYTYQAERYLAERRIPTLAGDRKVLVEFSGNIRLGELESALQVILSNGYVPIVAHIERYRCLMQSHTRTIALRRAYGAQFQINCDSLLHCANPFVHRTLTSLLAERQIDYVASDAHNTGNRACRMQEAYEKLVAAYGEPYANDLTGIGLTAGYFINR